MGGGDGARGFVSILMRSMVVDSHDRISSRSASRFLIYIDYISLLEERKASYLIGRAVYCNTIVYMYPKNIIAVPAHPPSACTRI